MNKTYRLGIIGHTGRGNYGHGIEVAFTKVPGVQVVALADADDAGRAAAAKKTGVAQTYASYREMLQREQLDIVAICPRWIDQHHDMLLAAANAWLSRLHGEAVLPFPRGGGRDRERRRNAASATGNRSSNPMVADSGYGAPGN
ncbi:MAG: Gfo/Idh/MocA family oxidoreductase [Planctomycetaceae bacterium]|nr:Gfo/Idh/MocA family oxidoreductase [Planctomycetaceae bacterium]